MISFLRGSALQKRLRDREKEVELDERDRKREKEELEEIRQRLLAEGHPDPDAELQRVRTPKNDILYLSFYLKGFLYLSYRDFFSVLKCGNNSVFNILRVLCICVDGRGS